MGTDLHQIDSQIERDIVPACLGAKQDEEGKVKAYLQVSGINADEIYEKFHATEATATEKKEKIISLALDVMEQAKFDEATDE